ncbi:dihydrofolate reductase family protein [Microbacterium sp. KUDC0406]|uniref:dihydrofolate reductase family protein n=1 Tax=Microbacterium sp. KUDC0406 TaxID=2909588 RepID=UPI001F1E4715|nr:dihydrofolate reductase family protein [Microbacterium sp. KUDC0406]UJP09762.1 dihydrofolate reductase family protein [Microbacterium sp. KUDC0406]
MRELTYYVAVSLDGFIAGPGGEFDFFLAEGDHRDTINERFNQTIPTQINEALGIPTDGELFDTVLMGWNTYAVGLPTVPSPYRHLRQVVFTSRTPDPVDGVEFTDRDPVEVVCELKSEPGKGIWLCGGGALAAALAEEIDRLVLKINPVLAGAGIPLFGERRYAPKALARTATTAFESGVVLAEYERAA